MTRKNRFMICICIGLLAVSGSGIGAWAHSSILPKELPKGWVLTEAPRVFTKANLFEHINGQAELFFTYGFERCIFAVYKNQAYPHQQIDLDVYEMGSVLQAFGIFSRVRGDDHPMNIGLDSYLDDHSALFYQGKYYVALYATEGNREVLRQFAEKVSKALPSSSSPPREIHFFPKDGLKSGSIQYFAEGFLGHQFLKGGFQGTYQDGDKEFHLFLALFGSPKEAKTGLEAFRNYLLKKGEVLQEILTGSGSVGIRGKDPYQGDLLVLQKGSYLVGILGSSLGEKGEKHLAEFIKRVQ